MALALRQFVGRFGDWSTDRDVPDGFLEAMRADRDALPLHRSGVHSAPP